MERIRDRKNQPRGILMARKINDETVGIGWALCKKTDHFDVEMGKKIAFGRSRIPNISSVPSSIRKNYALFCQRAIRYFKGQQIIGLNLFENNF
jgi:hypothetical protein